MKISVDMLYVFCEILISCLPFSSLPELIQNGQVKMQIFSATNIRVLGNSRYVLQNPRLAERGLRKRRFVMFLYQHIRSRLTAVEKHL